MSLMIYCAIYFWNYDYSDALFIKQESVIL